LIDPVHTLGRFASSEHDVHVVLEDECRPVEAEKEQARFHYAKMDIKRKGQD